MMGYAQRTKGYRIWLIDENKLVETINVRFDENKGINFRQKVNSNLGYNLNLPDYYDDEDDFDRVKDSLTSRLVSKTSTETPSTSENPDVSSDNHSLIPCTEVKWIRNIGRKVTGSNVYYSIEGEATRLKSFNEIDTAIRSRDASKWHDAMDKEINVMMERKVWDLVDHPDNIKILENRWVYTIKYDENNKIVRYKARLVARDSDFATNRDDRVSMGGFITFIDETPISWRTFKQKSVSLSNMEADYTMAFGDEPRNFEPDQVTWTTRELAPSSSNYHTTPREDITVLNRFNVHRCPTRWIFRGTGFKLMTCLP
ncbi:retrovirus-related Pol polyprotein from transposon RE1 [Trichonephila clavipes]|nr:retrovirus-related Pol polyprotein from transposon RE1 [Trichonephila clavipes]